MNLNEGSPLGAKNWGKLGSVNAWCMHIKASIHGAHMTCDNLHSHFFYLCKPASEINSKMWVSCASLPVDLKTRKRSGTSCQIEIHFSIKTAEFLFKYTSLRSQIYSRFLILSTKHNYKVLVSFVKEIQRYKQLKTTKRSSIRLLVPGLLLTVRSASRENKKSKQCQLAG